MLLMSLQMLGQMTFERSLTNATCEGFNIFVIAVYMFFQCVDPQERLYRESAYLLLDSFGILFQKLTFPQISQQQSFMP